MGGVLVKSTPGIGVFNKERLVDLCLGSLIGHLFTYQHSRLIGELVFLYII
jgi:hypothetical protein